MPVSWDKSDDRIWFGVWTSEAVPHRLYLIAECLPQQEGWDWTVWEPRGPRVMKREVAISANDAAMAAEAVAANWWEMMLTA